MDLLNQQRLQRAKQFEKDAEQEVDFGWKTTKLFYSALHYLHALAKQRNITLSKSHLKLREEINPKNTDRLLDFKKHAFDEYHLLRTHSEFARYEIMNNQEVWEETLKANFGAAKTCFDSFKKYLIDNQNLQI